MVINGHMVKSQPARGYAKQVGIMCVKQNMKPFHEDVEVHINWFRARKAGDIDSRQKTILDALNGFAYKDDRQIKRLIIQIIDTEKNNPRCVVRIKPICL
jgi:Holliday junction resolvase RusA-like endonuclease